MPPLLNSVFWQFFKVESQSANKALVNRAVQRRNKALPCNMPCVRNMHVKHVRRFSITGLAGLTSMQGYINLKKKIQFFDKCVVQFSTGSHCISGPHGDKLESEQIKDEKYYHKCLRTENKI